MPFHSNDHWPCRHVCCLLARCTLGYSCRSLWIQRLYQSHFAVHLQERQGQDHSWQLQGDTVTTLLVATIASTCTSMQSKGRASIHMHNSSESTYYTYTKPHTDACIYNFIHEPYTPTQTWCTWVHVSACTYVLTIVAYLVKTRVGYLLLATMYYQMVDLLKQLTNQLKPGTKLQ